jgi:hypothetical protein
MGPALHLPIHLLLLCYSVRSSYTFAANPPKATKDEEPAFLCRSTEVWTRPAWPTNIWQHCSELLDNMARNMPEVFDPYAPLHEFIPIGVRPAEPDLNPVWTPWKLSHGGFSLLAVDPSYSLVWAFYTFHYVIPGAEIARVIRTMYSSGNDSGHHSHWLGTGRGGPTISRPAWLYCLVFHP